MQRSFLSLITCKTADVAFSYQRRNKGLLYFFELLNGTSNRHIRIIATSPYSCVDHTIFGFGALKTLHGCNWYLNESFQKR